ncbi:NIL domain-containing protein, partial [Pseudomonas sp. PCH446]
GRSADCRSLRLAGPFVEQDEQGGWRLDLRLRLRGGSGRETVQARLQRKLRDRASALHGQVTQISARVGSLFNEAETLSKRLEIMSVGKTAKNFNDRQRSDKRAEYLGKLETCRLSSKKRSDSSKSSMTTARWCRSHRR